MNQSVPRTARQLYLWVAALFALVAGLVGIGVLSAAAFQQAVGDDGARLEAGQLYAQSNATISAAAAVYDALQDAERGQRGFALTQNPVFLDPYNENVSRVQPRIDSLARLVGDDTGDAAAIDSLRTIAQLKLEEMAGVVGMVERGDVSAARQDISTGYGRRLMEQIREMTEEIRRQEEIRLEERRTVLATAESETSESIQRLAIFGTALLVAALVAVIALAALLTRAYRAAEREHLIEAQKEALEAAVKERTQELTVANERLIAEAHSRESAEARLRQAQRMEAVGQLTGGIAHDFNNMLSVVIGSLDLLKRRTRDDAKLQGLIDNALEGADRAATLTARLLAFSRQQSLKPQVTNTNELLENLREFLQRTLGEQIQIGFDLATDAPPVFVDAAELENVIINLGANARDAMPMGGTLNIASAREDLKTARDLNGHVLAPGIYAAISIADTGEGMPADVLAKVYEPFFTTKPVGKGTGLGLSQVHGFVIQSGGAIEIESEPGKGTTIRLFLPEGEHRQEFVRLDADPVGFMPEARPGERVLTVEDQDQLRNLTVDVLREMGYEVEAAESADAALEILAKTNGAFSLLFTDIVMPGKSGDQLARAARSDYPDIRILYTSGYTQAAGVDARELDPPGDLLRKPYTVDQLAIAIRRAIDG